MSAQAQAKETIINFSLNFAVFIAETNKTISLGALGQ
jgi:hypothetical protein